MQNFDFSLILTCSINPKNMPDLVRSDKDLRVGVKTIVENWYSSSLSVDASASLPNYGFITKWENSVEFNTNIQIQPVMQFYSVDTNTIYPPQLEFKWRDYSSVLTGSASSSIVTTTNLATSLPLCSYYESNLCYIHLRTLNANTIPNHVFFTYQSIHL